MNNIRKNIQHTTAALSFAAASLMGGCSGETPDQPHHTPVPVEDSFKVESQLAETFHVINPNFSHPSTNEDMFLKNAVVQLHDEGMLSISGILIDGTKFIQYATIPDPERLFEDTDMRRAGYIAIIYGTDDEGNTGVQTLWVYGSNSADLEEYFKNK